MKNDFAERIAELSPDKQAQLLRLVERDGGVSNAYQLSLHQERIWFFDQLSPGSPLYNIPTVVRFAGDLQALSRSWSELMRRHETLRTSFSTLAGQPLQVVAPPAPQPLSVVDLQGLESGRREEATQALVQQEAWRPFNLRRGPLARLILFLLDPGEAVVLVTMHHIISDGWSVGVLLRELIALYKAFQTGSPSPLPDLPIQYKDFARWQRRWLTGDRLRAEVEHWQRQLSGAPAEIELPIDRPRPAVQSFRGGVESLPVLAKSLCDQLDAMARRRGATLFQTLLAAFGGLLRLHSRQSDLLLGTAVANRSRPETEGLIGYFANTLVLRLDFSGDPAFRDLLERVREVTLDAYAHQDLPFEKLVEALHPERSLSRSPIFQAAFDLQNLSAQGAELPGLRPGSLDLASRTSKFDLRLSMKETPTGLQGSLEYASDLFDQTTIRRLGEHLGTLLAGIVSDDSRRLSELGMLSGSELHQLLYEWNETWLEETWPRTAHAFFESQADHAPEAIAVAQGGESLTYGELDCRANQLARHLIALGAGPETLVGLCVERSLDMIVGLLGILKSGAAYLPLDPGNPRDRLRFMIEDARLSLLLTWRSLLDGLPENGARVVLLDSARDTIDCQPASRPATSAGGESLAYAIYTSGSTGRPKGAWLTHRGLCNLAVAFIGGFGLGPGSQVLQFSFFNFDASVVEIFMTLLGGATLHLARQDELFPGPGLVSLLRERQITAAIIPPSVLAAVPAASLPVLRTLIVAGEACGTELVDRWAPGRSFFNAYGPTEATVCASFTQCDSGGARPSIGRPIANVRTYVLDGLSHPVPIGVPGELHIGGISVGRGYLGRPELTAEKFVPDPFGAPGARLYRTGDFARLLPDGNLDLLGRIDHQVKVRGFRIELGEIEEVLRQHPALRQAAVVALGEKDGEKRVVAYVVAAGELVRERELRAHLEERLPKYMVPAAFVSLDALPLNSSGKLDLKALPDPGRQRPGSEDGFRPPRTGLETTITDIWRDVLGLEKVGLDDNFFEIGGHSLLLARVHDRLCKAVDRELTLIGLFTYPTVASLARYLQGESGAEAPAPAPAPAVPPVAGSDGTAVAVIGMSLRIAGSDSLAGFWANLRGGVESITFFSDEELLAAGVAPDLLRHPRYVKAGAYLEGIDRFDASFFGLNPRQAALMDPQHRIFLECAWEALENAGCAGELRGSIGIFAGCGANSYLYTLLANPGFLESMGLSQAALGNEKDHLATRTAYLLDLQGPSVTVQTACSTSLVAVHLACSSLRNDECEVALAGGVSIDTRGKSGYLPQEGGIRSPDGHCRAFDARAAGTMNSSGAGLVVLKRLDDALRDGDTIHAVIRGSAINNDGSSKVGYTAPQVEGQARVIRDAQIRAGVTADQISYVETHGTGTELGDPIEVAALTRAFRLTTGRRQYCALGSLKASSGHLDAAAGVAGLIKAVLAVQHREIPPSVHFEVPNPKIDFANSPFFVSNRLTDWQSEGPRRAGVSSFGIGGTNAHVVLEEAPPTPDPSPFRPAHLLVLSARTVGALEKASENLSRHLENEPGQSLADVEYTLQTGRRVLPYRRAIVVRDTAEAVESLAGRRQECVFSSHREQRNRSVVFLFTGHGSQYANMGRELYEQEPVYRDTIDRCARYLEPALGLDLRQLLYPDPGAAEATAKSLSAMSFAQPILFAVEYALAQLWTFWVGPPQAMIGHSMGEYVAACLSGSLSLEGALALVAARGRLMEETVAGSMLAVALRESELAPLLGRELSLAAVNGPGRCVVSGPTVAVERLQKLLTQNGIDSRRLHVSVAGHSSLMEPILQRFGEEVSRWPLREPSIPFVSNLTGTWITDIQATDPAYWVDHLRQTVRFADGLREIFRSTDGVLLEVGPGRSLTTIAAQHPERPAEREVFSSLSHAQERSSDLEFALSTLGRLWANGVRVDWQAFHAAGRRRRIPLPTYPFERQRYWVDPAHTGGVLPERAAGTAAGSFQALSWSRLEKPARPDAPPECWLVFLDDCGLGKALAQQLLGAGSRVATVRAGGGFARPGTADLVMDPGNPEHYTELVRELRSSGFDPQGIAHCWSVTAELPGDDAESFPRYLERGLKSLQFLIRSLAGDGGALPSRAVILGNHLQSVTGDEPLSPAKATVLGLCGVTLAEAPGLTVRAIDIVLPAAGSPAEARLLDALRADLAADAAPSLTAFRGHHRWARVSIPLAGDGGPEEVVVPEGGAFVLVGRLTGATAGFARHLARRRGARQALLLPQGDGEPEAAQRRLSLDLPAEAESIRQVEETLDKELALLTLADVEGFEELLDRLCASYVLEFLRSRGLDLSTRTVYRRDKLRQTLEILPKFDRLYERFLALLAEDGLLEMDGEQVVLLPTAALVPEPQSLRREAEERFPQFLGLVRLLDHCAGHYGPALSGAMPALEVLYPEGRADLLEQMAQQTASSNHQKLYIQTLCRLVAGLARKEQGRRLRILEVGAGSGVLTRSMLLALQGESFRYVFSDLSTAFVRRAEARTAELGLDDITFRVLDISKDLIRQGIDLQSFDVIVGLNVVHATPRLGETVGNLRQALAPGGLLGLVETVKPARWIDLTWGLAEGWWYFEDRDVRRVSPLAAPEVWEQVLRDQGFRHAVAYPCDAAGRQRKDTALILGQQTLEDPGAASGAAGQELHDRLAELKEMGADVVLLSVDASHPTALKSAFAAARERLGSIRGLIATVEDLEEAQALHPLLCDEERDFTVVSVAPRQGSGEAAIAANAASEWLDTFTRQAREQGRRVHLLRWTGEMPKSCDEGERALRSVLRQDAPEVLIVKSGDTSRPSAPDTPHETAGLEAALGEPGESWAPPETALERKIAAIWEEQLGRRVGRHDNFFDLGGDSLIALNVTSKIRQHMNVELPLRHLLEAPTVAALAAKVTAQLPHPPIDVSIPAPGTKDLPSTLVRIQSGAGSKLPFFTIHAAGGNVLCYYNLARQLGPERPVYALQAPGLEGTQQVFDRIEDLAAFHVSAIRSFQEHGPYLVGGWSAGGTVAFEVARQLEAMGEEVPLIALMDTYAPVENYDFDELKLLMWQAWRFHLPLAVEELERLATFEERLELVVGHAFKAGIIAGHLTPEDVRRGLLVEIANLKAMLAYRPAPFSGTLSFFRSQEGSDFGDSDGLFPWINELDHAVAWKQITGMPLVVYEVPGGHSSLMDDPNVGVLAEYLRSLIQNVEASCVR